MASKIKVYGKAQNRTALGIAHAYLVMYPHATLEDLRKAFPNSICPDKGAPENFLPLAEAEALMKFAVATYGRIDILVNNAGITRDNLVLGMKETDFDDVININLKGTFNCIKHVYRTMMKQKYGRIINMSSVVGIEGNAGQVNYAASKAGVIGITKSIAKELGSRGITANAIAPGFIKTDMTDALSDKAKEAMLDHITVKRLGEVSDIAETAAFLASDKASYITGQVIKVDGGMSL
mgnify:CR=1 FL=1